MEAEAEAEVVEYQCTPACDEASNVRRAKIRKELWNHEQRNYHCVHYKPWMARPPGTVVIGHLESDLESWSRSDWANSLGGKEVAMVMRKVSYMKNNS